MIHNEQSFIFLNRFDGRNIILAVRGEAVAKITDKVFDLIGADNLPKETGIYFWHGTLVEGKIAKDIILSGEYRKPMIFELISYGLM